MRSGEREAGPTVANDKQQTPEKPSQQRVHFEYTNREGRSIRCSEAQAKELAALKPHCHPRRVVSLLYPVAGAVR